ncbi:LOW QUALITY PROTEIN: DC-STAMP domain-containing protein 2 [Heptranchias perlo]|uniref:LOW QUALITY PROTEIN: DC-STAMP domain-containing protein 2 n=1 Tax=Heptranchias perlo TaxID=212740 RepID=UPI00355A5521
MSRWNKMLRMVGKSLKQKQSKPWLESLRILALRWIYIITGRPRKAKFAVYKRRRLQMCFESCCPCCPDWGCWEGTDKLQRGDVVRKEMREAWIKEDNIFKECLRSLGGFAFGLLFTSVYGLFVLFVQEYNLWYCLVSTITIAVLLGLGMGLSAKIRINVFLMFPHIFSKQGKTFLLALAFGLVIEGPLQNIIVNFTRGSESVACGAELAMNQTKELMQKAKAPLIAALEKIKIIAQSAKGVGDRVRKFFVSMKNSIKHIVRILRNIVHWFSHIGTMCNKELGEPYRKCVKVFDDAINHCLGLLGIFGFLCYIVNIVKPLCGLVTIIQLFCLIPTYIKNQLTKRLGERECGYFFFNPCITFRRGPAHAEEGPRFNVSSERRHLRQCGTPSVLALAASAWILCSSLWSGGSNPATFWLGRGRECAAACRATADEFSAELRWASGINLTVPDSESLDAPAPSTPKTKTHFHPVPFSLIPPQLSRMLWKVTKEFEFNISMQHHFHIHANQSKSLSHVALDIMEEIRVRLGGVYECIGIFGYSSTLMMLYLYIRALLYRKNYLFRDDFDNCYITNQFVEIDIMRANTGKSTILPLSFREACRYIRPCSIYLTASEKKRYIIGFATVLRQSISNLVIILLDYAIYWILDMVSYHLQSEIIARSPVVLGISINGTGYASDIYRNVVDAFDVVQSGNITIVSKKCAIIPSPPNYRIYMLIGGLYGAAFFIVLFGSYISRLRRYVCSIYYPSRERERICYLYNQIHSKRTSLVNALFRTVQKNSTDAGHTSILLVLAARFKLFAWIAAQTGISQDYCMACGRMAEGEEYELFVSCITPGCKGFYCTDCYQHMNNICSICMGPLAYQGDIDEEVDSSDSGKVKLWISALETLKTRQDKVKQERKKLRRLLKEKIKAALYEDLSITAEKDTALRAVLREMKPAKKVKTRRPSKGKADSLASDLESGESQRHSTKSEGELDFRYQDESAAGETTSDEPYDPSEFTEKRTNRDIVTVADLEPLRLGGGRSATRTATTTTTSGGGGSSSEPWSLGDVRVDTATPVVTTVSSQTEETYGDMNENWELVLPDLNG